jgi:phosphate transport system substrate-binding protein
MRLSLRAAGLATLLTAAAILLPLVASAEPLRLGGTGGASAMLQQVGALFATRSARALQVYPGLGSGGGIMAAGDGVIDVAVSGRPLSEKERASGFTAPLTMRTPYVLATSCAAPPALAHLEVVRLFSDPRAAWPDGTPVRIILRPRTESDNAVLFALFPGTEAAVERARQRDDVPMAPTDQDNQYLAVHTPGSLTGTTYTQMLLEHRDLRMIAIDGVPPSIAGLTDGTYRYEKKLWFVVPARPTPAAEQFIAFLRAPEGQLALLEAGLVPPAK